MRNKKEEKIFQIQIFPLHSEKCIDSLDFCPTFYEMVQTHRKLQIFSIHPSRKWKVNCRRHLCLFSLENYRLKLYSKVEALKMVEIEGMSILNSLY